MRQSAKTGRRFWVILVKEGAKSGNRKGSVDGTVKRQTWQACLANKTEKEKTGDRVGKKRKRTLVMQAYTADQ